MGGLRGDDLAVPKVQLLIPVDNLSWEREICVLAEFY